MNSKTITVQIDIFLASNPAKGKQQTLKVPGATAADGQLVIRMGANDTAQIVFRWLVEDRQQTHTIGSFPSVKLPNEAAILREWVTLCAAVADGRDPRDHSPKGRQKAAVSASRQQSTQARDRAAWFAANTIEAWGERWKDAVKSAHALAAATGKPQRIDDEKIPGPDLLDSLSSVWRRWVLPKMGHLVVTEITEEIVGAEMDAMRNSQRIKGREYAIDEKYPEGHSRRLIGAPDQDIQSRVLSTLRRVIRHAAMTGKVRGLNKDVLASKDLSKKVWKHEDRVRPFMEQQHLRLFWGELDFSTQIDRAVAFQLLTGCRRSEVAGPGAFEWRHYDEEAQTLYLPITKSGVSHTIQLTGLMLDIIDMQKNYRLDAHDRLFNYASSAPLRDRVARIRNILIARGERFPANMNNHGLRRTFGFINAQVRGANQQAVDSSLNHVEKSVGAVSYQVKVSPVQRAAIWAGWDEWITTHLINGEPFNDIGQPKKVDRSRKPMLVAIKGGKVA